MTPDNDPFGLQEWQEQKWAIFKRRLIRYGFPPAAIGLIVGTGWLIWWVWSWVLR